MVPYFRIMIVLTSFFKLTFKPPFLSLVFTHFCFFLLKIMKNCCSSLMLLNLMDVLRIIPQKHQNHERFFLLLTFCNYLIFFLPLFKLLLILKLLIESAYVAFHLCINQKEYAFYHQFTSYLLLNL